MFTTIAYLGFVVSATVFALVTFLGLKAVKLL